VVISGYARSSEQAGVCACCVSLRKVECRGKEENEGENMCALCTRGECLVLQCGGKKQRRRKMERKGPLLRCFSFSSFGACLYSTV